MSETDVIDKNEEIDSFKYIDIGSTNRNRNLYPNPFDFVVPYNQVNQSSTNLTDPVLLTSPYTGSDSLFPGQLYIQYAIDEQNIVLDQQDSDIENYYVNSTLQIGSDYRTIVSYDSVTKVASCSAPFDYLPSPGTLYFTRKNPVYFNSNISILTYNGDGVTRINLLSGSPSPVKDLYKGSYIRFTNGPHVGKTVLVTGYTPSGNTSTWTQANVSAGDNVLVGLTTPIGIVFKPSISGVLFSISISLESFETISPGRNLVVEVREGIGLTGNVVLTEILLISNTVGIAFRTLNFTSNPSLTTQSYTMTFLDTTPNGNTYGFVRFYGIVSTYPNVINTTTLPRMTVNFLYDQSVLIWSQPQYTNSSLLTSSTCGILVIPIGSGDINVRSVSLNLISYGNRVIRFSILEGAGLTGTNIYTIDVNIADTYPATDYSFNINANITAGNSYTFTFSDISVTSGYLYFYGITPDALTYQAYNINTYPKISINAISYNVFSQPSVTYNNEYLTPTEYGYLLRTNSSVNSRSLNYIQTRISSFNNSLIPKTAIFRIRNGSGLLSNILYEKTYKIYSNVSQMNETVGTNYTNTPQMGYSVSLNYDGTILAVGGPNDNSGVGAVWIFQLANDGWYQTQVITPTNNTGNPFFGCSVSFNSDGSYLAIGGNTNNSGIGGVWIYTLSGSYYVYQTMLIGTGNVGVSNQGTSVVLNTSATLIAIGGIGDNSGAGAVWTFTRSGSVWTQQQKFTETSTGQYGNSVSLSLDGTKMMVGAPTTTSNNGKVFFYNYSGSWSLTNSFTGVNTSKLGQSVNMTPNGDWAVAGEPNRNSGGGMIWTFEFSGGSWIQRESIVYDFTANSNVGTSVVVKNISNGLVLAYGSKIYNTATGSVVYTTRTNTPITFSGSVSGTNLTVSSVTSGRIQIGQLITKTGLTTFFGKITGFVSGEYGGVGVYTLSNSQTDSGNYISNWKEERVIIGSSVTTTSQQGVSVDLNNDGSILSFGSIATNVNVGSSWVFKINVDGINTGFFNELYTFYLDTFGVSATQNSKLIGTTTNTTNQQGKFISLSKNDGSLLAEGGLYNNDGIWTFNYSNGIWSETDTLFPYGYVGNGNITGVKVNGDGTTIVHASNNDDTNIGAIWIYRKFSTPLYFLGEINDTTLNVTDVYEGTLRVGSFINSPYVAKGTQIIKFISAGGNVGTYMVNISQTTPPDVSMYSYWYQEEKLVPNSGTNLGTSVAVNSSGTSIVAGTGNGYIYTFSKDYPLEVSNCYITNNTLTSITLVSGSVKVGQYIYSPNGTITQGTQIIGTSGGFYILNKVYYGSYSGQIMSSWHQNGSRITATDTATPTSSFGSFVDIDSSGNNISVSAPLYESGNTGGIWSLYKNTVVFTGYISGTTLTVSTISTGRLKVGQIIYSSFVTNDSTKIVSFSSGTGGVGTYTVSSSQSVSNRTMYGDWVINPKITISGVVSINTPVLSGDGNFMAFQGFVSNLPLVYIFKRNADNTFTQFYTPFLPNGYNGGLGNSLVLSLNYDGSLLSISSPFQSGNYGLCWLYARSNNVWKFVSTIFGTGNIGNASQGFSLSMGGNVLAIGGINDNSNQGAVWTFDLQNIPPMITSSGFYTYTLSDLSTSTGVTNVYGINPTSYYITYNGSVYPETYAITEDNVLSNIFSQPLIPDYMDFNGGIYNEFFYINDMKVIGLTLVAGGYFTNVGSGVTSYHIAKYDLNLSSWIYEFGTGFNNSCDAIACTSLTNLFAGGTFTIAGGNGANYIAYWNGYTWTALSTGLNARCRTLALDNTNNILFVGGDFTTAGGISSPYLSLYTVSISGWRALSTGLFGSAANVYCMGTDALGNLYIGGAFNIIGLGSGMVAKWNGTSWTILASASGTCYSILVKADGTLYAGGSFTTIGGVSANNIAYWGGSLWSALGTGLNGTCYALSNLFNGGFEFFAGGNFTTAGGVSANNIARWDNGASSWIALSGGLNGQCNSIVSDGYQYVYVGGQFTNAGGVSANYIARWNYLTSTWTALGTGLGFDANILYLDMTNNNLYVGGGFTTAGGITSNFIAKWNINTQVWSNLSNGFNNICYSLSMDTTGNLYAGGQFTTAGGITVNNIAIWDGSSWSSMDGGFVNNIIVGTSGVYSMNIFNNSLYAGGNFETTTSGITVNRIAKWVIPLAGSAWSAPSVSPNGICRSITLDNSGNAYIGGDFTNVGNRVAKYNYFPTWVNVGNDTSNNGIVYAIAKDNVNNYLYVGGTFTSIGGISANRIARYNITTNTWSALGTGLNLGGTCYALEVDNNNNLYAAGNFPSAGGISLNNIAMWNGSSWSALGNGIVGGTATCYALKFKASGTLLYVGGDFSAAGPLTNPYISSYNTTTSTWTSVSSLNSVVRGLDVDSLGNLYACGNFTYISSNYVAKWNGSVWSGLGNGVYYPGYSIAIDSNNNVYVAGFAYNISKWNGFYWVNIYTDQTSTPRSLKIDSSNNVYVAGLNGLIRKWNGVNWNIIGTPSGNCYVVYIDVNTLYMGGDFITNVSFSGNRISKYSPAGGWITLGSGLNNICRTVNYNTTNNRLYAGGSFTTAGVVNANYIAYWDGIQWSALGTGLNGICRNIGISSTGVYALGDFNRAGTVNTPTNMSTSFWNGSVWTNIGSLSGSGRSIYSSTSSSTVYIATDYTTYTTSNNYPSTFSRWDGTTLTNLNAGAVSFCKVVNTYSSNFYVGGLFSSIGGISANNIARWDGLSWYTLGTGLNGTCYGIAFDNTGNLYACGNFTTAGGVSANYIARWNGSVWSSLGTGLNGVAFSIAIDNLNNVYVGGIFTVAGVVVTNYIAKWNGSVWSTLGTGLSLSGGNAICYSLTTDSLNNLYAGGVFTTAGGVTVNNIAMWNGSVWSALGSGLDGTCYALKTDSSNNLYAGGAFITAGGVTTNYIAKWNGSAWSALSTGLNDICYAITVDSSNNVFAGGNFTIVGGININRIAKWNGTLWSQTVFGTGVNNTCYSIAISGTTTYAGGIFNVVNDNINTNLLIGYSTSSISVTTFGFRVVPTYTGMINNIIMNVSTTGCGISVSIIDGAGLSGTVLDTQLITIGNINGDTIIYTPPKNNFLLLSTFTVKVSVLTGTMSINGTDPNVNLISYSTSVYPRVFVTGYPSTICSSQTSSPTATELVTNTFRGYEFTLTTISNTLTVNILESNFGTRNINYKILQGSGLSGTTLYSGTFSISSTNNSRNLFTSTTFPAVLSPGTYTLAISDGSISTDGVLYLYGIPVSGSGYTVYNTNIVPQLFLTSDTTQSSTLLYSQPTNNSIYQILSIGTEYGFKIRSPSVSFLGTILARCSYYSSTGNRTIRVRLREGAGVTGNILSSTTFILPNSVGIADRNFNIASYLLAANIDYTVTFEDVTPSGSGIFSLYGVLTSSLTPEYQSYNTLMYPKITIGVLSTTIAFSQNSNPSVTDVMSVTTEKGYRFIPVFSGNIQLLNILLTSFNSNGINRTFTVKIYSGGGFGGNLEYTGTLNIPNTLSKTYVTLQLNPGYFLIDNNVPYTISFIDTTPGGTSTGNTRFYGITPNSLYTTYNSTVYPRLRLFSPLYVLDISPPQPIYEFLNNSLDNIEFNTLAYDNFSSLLHSSLPHTRSNYYRIRLESVSLPKRVLNVSYGGTLQTYPYIYVSIYNKGNRGVIYSMFSNNFNSASANFKIPIKITNYDDPTTFYTIKTENKEQIIHFRPDQDIGITYYLPDGSIIQLKDTDTTSPDFPNEILQTSILFSIKGISYEEVLGMYYQTQTTENNLVGYEECENNVCKNEVKTTPSTDVNTFIQPSIISSIRPSLVTLPTITEYTPPPPPLETPVEKTTYRYINYNRTEPIKPIIKTIIGKDNIMYISGTNIDNNGSSVVSYNIDTDEMTSLSGLDGECKCLTYFNGVLYAGGAFGVYKYSKEKRWTYINPNLEGICNSMVVDSGILYMGGKFKYNGIETPILGMNTKMSINNCSYNISGECKVITIVNKECIYIGGRFYSTKEGELVCAHFSSINSTWIGIKNSSKIGGVCNSILSLSDGTIYLGGKFIIGKKNCALLTLEHDTRYKIYTDITGETFCFTWNKGVLYLGGNLFFKGEETPLLSVSKTNISKVSNDISGICYSLYYSNKYGLYIAGEFSNQKVLLKYDLQNGVSPVI